jgi:hypothetical protein
MGAPRPGGAAVLSFDAPTPPPLPASSLAFLLRWRGLPPSPSEAVLDALRTDVLAAWRDVKTRAHVYRCVQELAFLTPRVPRHPAYAALLAHLAAAREAGAPADVADVGAAFGQEARALVADGVPASSCVVADICDVYWRAGVAVFDAGDETRMAAARTRWGDWAAPLTTQSGDAGDIAAGLSLAGVLCFFVLHVLTRQQGAQLLARLRRAAAPGALLLGACVGAAVAGDWALTPDGAAPRWLHSPASLADALRDAGWCHVTVTAADPAADNDALMARPKEAAHAAAMAQVLRLQFSAAAAPES